MKKISLLIVAVLLVTLGLNGQDFTTKPIPLTNEIHSAKLEQNLKSFSAFELNLDNIADLQIESNYQIPSLTVAFNAGLFNTTLYLENSRIISDNYVRHTSSGAKIDSPIASGMKGFTEEGFPVKITINESYFHGYIEAYGTKYYIEPIATFDESLPQELFIIYDIADMNEIPEGNCGTHGETLPQLGDEVAGKVAAGECLEVEYALAADWSMYEKYGSIHRVENQIISVTNAMNSNYTDDFSDEIRYKIVETYYVDCETCDPWSSTTEANELLLGFTNWARGPLGFKVFHDLGGLWSARTLDDDVVGIAWSGGLCTFNRYHVLTDFTEHAEALRVTASHEIGHNFGAEHDAEGDPYIMAPTLTIANDWSPNSINTINTTISNRRSGTCLEECTVGGDKPVADFTTDFPKICKGNAILFINNSENADSYEWYFEGGSPETSTDESPYVIYPTAGEYTVSLIAINSFGTDTLVREAYISVITSPIVSFASDIDGLTVHFTNTTDYGETFFWDFGDGNSSSDENTTHRYTEDGEYLVEFTVRNICGEDSHQEAVAVEDNTVEPPHNDNPCFAVYINPDGSCENGTTAGATPDWGGVCNESYYESSVYYQTIIPAGQNKLKVVVDGLTEMAILVLDFNAGCYEAPLIVNAYCGGTPYELVSDVEEGKAYHILISTSVQDTGKFTICLDAGIPPPGCSENETCETAALVSQQALKTLGKEVCIDACNIRASGGNEFGECIPETWSVIFFSFATDVFAETATITVRSEENEEKEMAIAFMPDCTSYTTCTTDTSLSVTLSDLPVQPLKTYYFAIATPEEDEGWFSVCVSTGLAEGKYCISRDDQADTSQARLLVTGTSMGSPLNGPYIPGEEVSFEYYIPNYNTSTSMQWLQGIVPIFGAGWDPASFDGNGMPVISSGPNSHGATWQWWRQDDVRFNGNTLTYSIYTDSLGQIDMCHFMDPDCINSGIVYGQGLPAGWYAAQACEDACPCDFDGSPNSGYGDGNTGPWTVTFTLKVRSYPGPEGCIETGFVDCTVKMFTFSEDQIGCSDVGNDPNACSADVYKEFVAESRCCELPQLSFDVNLNGLLVEFINTSEGALSYFWDFGDGNTSTEENPIHSYSDYGQYTVILSGENDCGPYSYEYILDVVDRDVLAAFDLSQNAGCEPLTVNFINQSIGEGMEFYWAFEGGTPENSTDENPSVVYVNPGTYGVTLIAFNEFSADTVHYDEYITVHPLPVADFVYEMSGDTVQFMQTSLYASRYEWDFGNGMNGEGANPTVVYTEPGEYDVTLIVSNDCGSDTIVRKVEIITGIEEIPLDAIVVFPNPFDDILNIRFSPELSGIVELNLMDISGKLMFAESFNVDNSVKRIVKLSGLQSGLYILEIRNEGKVAYRKLVK